MFEEKTKEKPQPKAGPPLAEAEKPKTKEEAKVWAEIEKAPTPEIREEMPSAKEAEMAAGPPRRRIPFLHKKPKEPEVILETSETAKEIEVILSEGLEEVYQNLPENLKERFREDGRETASKIEKVISGAKIAVKKVLDLIRKWLTLIPGANRFFLEQESKIKTGKILALAERKRKQKIEL